MRPLIAEASGLVRTISMHEKAEADEDGERRTDDGEKRSQADVLADYGTDCGMFVDTADNSTVFADITAEDGHRETVRIESSPFRDWLRRKYYLDHKKSARADAISQAIETIRACALFSPKREQRAVFLRTAKDGETHYLDLGDATWRAVKISADGWEVVSNPPVRFRRNTTLGALPEPTKVDAKDGLAMLRPFVNTKSEDDFVLLVAWLLYAFRGVRPFPVLPLTGEHGAGKSTLCRHIKRIVDPNQAPVRAVPGNEHDLLVTATRQHVLCFDNVSGIQPWMSDALCRIADGAGMGKRKLYSDDEEATLIAACPIVLNGITEFVTRADLADRSVFIALEPISEEERRDDTDMHVEFEKALPSILGALLDAMVHGLKMFSNVHLSKRPRMAGFAKWGAACEAVFWPAGTFEKAYASNRKAADESVLEADSVVPVLRDWFEELAEHEWEGRTSVLASLLKTAGAAAAGAPSGTKEWPATAQRLAPVLKRATPSLRKIGLEVTIVRRNGRSHTRIVEAVPRPIEPHEPHCVTVGDAQEESSAMSPSGFGGREGHSTLSPPKPLVDTEALRHGIREFIDGESPISEPRLFARRGRL